MNEIETIQNIYELRFEVKQIELNLECKGRHTEM